MKLEVKLKVCSEEYVTNSELIKKYKCFIAFSNIKERLFCYPDEGSQRKFKLDFLTNPSLIVKKEYNSSAKSLLM